MSKRSRFIARVEKRWMAFFGEPPVIRDPVLMLKILEDCERAAAAPAARAA